MKGIETMTTFALTVEAGVFSRFDSARAFASWLGLVSSEHSSGERTSGAASPKPELSLAEAARGGILALHPRHERAKALALR